MFLLKSLYGKVWSDTNSTELAQISTGELYLVRPGSIQGSRECLFKNSMVTIRRSTQEFNFQLVVTRVFEEGEEQLVDEAEETEDERSFLIDQQLEFSVGTFEGEPAFRWRDLQGDPHDVYEFVAVGTNTPTSNFFESCIYKAMYERKYHKSADDASDNDLKQFVFSPDAPSYRADRQHRSLSREDSLSTAVERMNLTPVKGDTPKKVKVDKATPQAQLGTMLLSADAELFYWDANKAEFEFQGTCVAQISQVSQYQFHIVARQNNSAILFHEICADNNCRFSEKSSSFTWNNIDSAGNQTSWCLNFLKQEKFEEWKSIYGRSMYETLNQSSWEKMKSDEQTYIMSSYNDDVVMKDAEEEEEDEEEEVKAELALESESDSEDERGGALRAGNLTGADSSDDDRPQLPAGKNEQLTVGFNKDRSYVVRGDKIGVFKATSEGKMEHHGTLSQVKNTRGKTFKPKKMMLHDQDNTMILMDPSIDTSLFKLDIESGKVVEEWKVDDNIPVLHLAPETKFAQTQPERTVLGASGNALFRIDPRLSGNKLVDSEYKQYTTKNKFSSLATTEEGKVAVASEKGDIRLFDKVGKNAKTALPAIGDPILGVDVTKDGRWLVATCKTYLLVIDTLIQEGKSAGQLGFDKSFPADAKPTPRRLRLLGPHVQYMGGQVSLSPARFNMGEDQEETTIVTSSGNYVIAWDFKAVKKGKYDKYEIRKYQDTVVQDQFRFGDPNDIVVALQNNVVMVNKKHLKSPAQVKSYGRRSSTGGSKSAIVNSPY